MSKTPYVALYPTDFLADVGHLGNTELGIYTRLLLVYYRDARPLPYDTDKLRRIAMTFSPEESKALNEVLTEFFVPTALPDGSRVWRHNRADKEILRASSVYEHKVAGAAKAREAKALKSELISGLIPTRYQPENQNQNQNQKEIKDSHSYAMGGIDAEKTAPNPEAAVVEQVLLDCPAQKLVDLYHRKLPSAPQCLVLTQTRRGYLKARWREYAVIKGWQTEADGMEFFGEFFDFVARSKFLTGRANGRDGRAPFVADMEWLFRPGNFAKVIEGKYHA